MRRLPVPLALLLRLSRVARASHCLEGPCSPGNDYCGEPFANAPVFHLMDQHGCRENDPNGPIFDPVHGVIHHFYQIHLAAPPGRGPDYGHFVSKDFVLWADVRTAIWNGLDASVSPPAVTTYDDVAIFTGSAFVMKGAGPDGKGPGIINLYPGLCSAERWPQCGTGTLLAQAVPADYANDELLVNWTKPAYNPVMENTQRDPSTPWRTPHGEWRFRTYDSKVYAAGSDADVVKGLWYEVGTTPDFRTCECPSFYPLPKSTPGFENAYSKAAKSGHFPTHVHKTSCGGDWWQLGTYVPGGPRQLDHFNATPGWEDLFVQRRIDVGNFYASKDDEYPTKGGGVRRINWGWATVAPAGVQSLPREITFNPEARTLEQAPIEELRALRGRAAFSKKRVRVSGAALDLGLAPGVARQSEVLVTFELPTKAAKFGVSIGSSNSSANTSDSNLSCTVDYQPPRSSSESYDVRVDCSGRRDTLRLLPGEHATEIRVFSDWTFSEVYFHKGRVAMTIPNKLRHDAGVSLASSTSVTAASVAVYPMKSIWTTAEEVRKAPRIFGQTKTVVV